MLYFASTTIFAITKAKFRIKFPMQIFLHLRTSCNKLAILIMSRLNEAQKKAKEYVDEHKVEKIISEMINSLVHTKDKKPIIFMVITFNIR